MPTTEAAAPVKAVSRQSDLLSRRSLARPGPLEPVFISVGDERRR